MIDLLKRCRTVVSNYAAQNRAMRPVGIDTLLTDLDAAIAQQAEPVAPNDAALLLRRIRGHQYGLRGFGDGSLSRGRDLTDAETRTITNALAMAASPQPPAAQPEFPRGRSGEPLSEEVQQPATEYPPLPEPYSNIYPRDEETCVHHVCFTPSTQPTPPQHQHQPVFTADQMRAYAAADRAARAARAEQDINDLRKLVVAYAKAHRALLGSDDYDATAHERRVSAMAAIEAHARRMVGAADPAPSQAAHCPHCPHCHRPAADRWTQADLQAGFRWEHGVKTYHCREAAVGD